MRLEMTGCGIAHIVSDVSIFLLIDCLTIREGSDSVLNVFGNTLVRFHSARQST
jgi:hypothetical protein